MSATALGAIIAIAAGYAASIFAIIWYLGGRIDRLDKRIDDLGANVGGRIDGLAGEVSNLRVDLGRIGQKLDDHVTNHPGPTERLVR